MKCKSTSVVGFTYIKMMRMRVRGKKIYVNQNDTSKFIKTCTGDTMHHFLKSAILKPLSNRTWSR